MTSRELLHAAGVEPESKPEIPLEWQSLLITSAIKFIPAKKFMEALNQEGESPSLREVIDWQNATRKWLGLPKIGRGKPSKEYRDAVQKWLAIHGNPTLEEIDAGWLPKHLRREQPESPRPLSPRYESMLNAFRHELSALMYAKNDQEAKKLLAIFIGDEALSQLDFETSTHSGDTL